MIILGIDPGTTAVGYACIETSPEPRLLAADLLKISSGDPHEQLLELHHGMAELIQTWNPEAVAVERLFFAKNAKTAIPVAQARGVILLTTSLAKRKVYEYTPLEVKKGVTGDGGADKTQLKKIIQLTVRGAKTLRARDDVFDAIGLALTCCFNERLQGNLLQR